MQIWVTPITSRCGGHLGHHPNQIVFPIHEKYFKGLLAFRMSKGAYIGSWQYHFCVANVVYMQTLFEGSRSFNRDRLLREACWRYRSQLLHCRALQGKLGKRQRLAMKQEGSMDERGSPQRKNDQKKTKKSSARAAGPHVTKPPSEDNRAAKRAAKRAAYAASNRPSLVVT